jgi:carbonic anhydrase
MTASRLQALLDRNVAWAEAKTKSDPSFFVRMAGPQSPKYLWLGCSDSRVTANDVLGLDPGAVFVHRNIANFVHTSDMNFLAVLEYALTVLRVQDVIVCGHYACGGVARALEKDRSALVDHWLQPLVMLNRKHAGVFKAMPGDRERQDRMSELNVEMQVRRLAMTPIVERVWQSGEPLFIHGWLYGVEDGLIRDMRCTVSSMEARDALPSIDERVLSPAEPWSAVRQHAMDAFGRHDPGCCS